MSEATILTNTYTIVEHPDVVRVRDVQAETFREAAEVHLYHLMKTDVSMGEYPDEIEAIRADNGTSKRFRVTLTLQEV